MDGLLVDLRQKMANSDNDSPMLIRGVTDLPEGLSSDEEFECLCYASKTVSGDQHKQLAVLGSCFFYS